MPALASVSSNRLCQLEARRARPELRRSEDEENHSDSYQARNLTSQRPRVEVGSELRRSLVGLRSELQARALRMSRSSAMAEDLVQDTIERAMKFESHYIPGTNVRAWVFQILFSVFITRCRRSRREKNALAWLSTDPNAWTVPQKAAPMQTLSPALEVALRDLPESFRHAVELVDLGEMSYRDAADKMGVPVGTVMSRLHRGRKLLATALRESDLDDEVLAAA